MWPCIIYISKEDVPTWCKQFYYDFFHKWPLHVSDIYMSIFRSSYIQVVALPHVVLCTTHYTPTPQDHSLNTYGITPHAAVKQPIYKNSWRWTCKCPKHVEAIYEKNHSKIVCIKLVHLPYLYIWCTVTLISNSQKSIIHEFGEQQDWEVDQEIVGKMRWERMEE